MARSVRYSPELRAELLGRVERGDSPEELAGQFEPTAQTIRNWVKAEESAVMVSPESGRSVTELEETVSDLEKKLADSEESVEILKKAAAWFAAETRPRRSSSSKRTRRRECRKLCGSW